MDRQIGRSARSAARSGSGAGSRMVTIVLVGAMAITGVTLAAQARGFDVTDLGAWGRGRAFISVDGKAVAVPRPLPATGRVLPAVPVTSNGRYAFVHTTPEGDPIGYDPCRPIRYVVRVEGAPALGESLIRDAVAQISAATGLAFVDAGLTQEAPTLVRTLIQPGLYGDGWAPVLIAWSNEQEMPSLGGDVAGLGGSAMVPGSSGGGQWLAAGRLALDGEDLGQILTDPEGYATARAIIVHELAHVVGLDHVDDPSELMNPVTTGIVQLGPGDREGLALVGAVACES